MKTIFFGRFRESLRGLILINLLLMFLHFKVCILNAEFGFPSDGKLSVKLILFVKM